MKRMPVLVVAAAVAALGFAGAAATQPGDPAAAGHSEFSAQKKKKAKRAPTRIRVQPLYRHYRGSSEFPRPDDISAPGPNAVRLCRSWLAPEHRPSGTVIVPYMRCWWERG
jgi:hypothetical protein